MSRGSWLVLLGLTAGCLRLNPDWSGEASAGGSGGASSGSSATGSTATTGGTETSVTGVGPGSASATSDATSGTTSTSGGMTTGTSGGMSSGSSGGQPVGECPAHPNLIACYAFPGGEVDTLVDGSSNGRHGTMDMVALEDSVMGYGKALALNSTSDVTIMEQPAFDPPRLTISVLVRPDTEGQILDNDQQYGLQMAGGQVLCSVKAGGSFATAKAPITMGAWSHVGCIHDGVTLSLQVTTMGPLKDDAVQANGPLYTGAMQGVVIGNESPQPNFPWAGLLDHLLLFDEALTHEALCAYHPFCA